MNERVTIPEIEGTELDTMLLRVERDTKSLWQLLNLIPNHRLNKTIVEFMVRRLRLMLEAWEAIEENNNARPW